MTNKSETVIFFGNERLATGVTTTASTLQALIDTGYNVVAVVSHNDETTSRKARQLEIAEVAKAHNIPVFLPGNPDEIADQLASYHADIGVLVAYGQFVSDKLINSFPHGIINIHPSLLPKHRGPIPIESVILNGESETGVSIMGLVSAVDGGPVYAQTKLQLHGNETKQALADKLLALGSEMIVEVLEQLFAGTSQPTTQDENAATFEERLTKEDGILDFSKSAVTLEREVRAYLNWPNSRTNIGDKQIIVTKAHVVDGKGELGKIWKDGKQFGFYTTSGILVIDSLKPAGKQEMSAEAFLAGYGKSLLL